MKNLIILALTLLAVNANAAILCQSPNGSVSYAPATLAAAAVSPSCRNTSVVVTTALSAVQSNISSATVHAWPADRALEGRKGGSIGNTTVFAFADGATFTAGNYQAFTGSGTVTGLKESRPEWFGGAADGTTNSTGALQKAALAGKTLKLTDGTYMVNGSTLLPDNIVVVGTGKDKTIIKVMTSATGSVNVFQNSNYTAYGGKGNPTVPDYSVKTPNYNITIKDLTIDCDEANNTATTNGFIFTLTDGVTVENVKSINSSQKGGYIQSSKNIVVTKSEFTSNVLNGLHVCDCIAFDIHHNTFDSNTDYALEVGAGDTTSTPNATINMPTTYGGDGTVTHNTVSGGVTVGIYLRGFNSRYIQDVQVASNTVNGMTEGDIGTDPSTGSGIATSDYTKRIEITKNKLTNNANSGLYIFAGTGESGYVITGNYCSLNKYGMNLNGLSYATISSNKIQSSEDTSIILNYLFVSEVKNNYLSLNGTVTAGNSMIISNNQQTKVIDNIFQAESHTKNIVETTGNANTNLYLGNDTPKGNTWASASFVGDRFSKFVPSSFASDWTGSAIIVWGDSSGIVHMQGLATKGSAVVAGATMFTLPAPYRPEAAVYVPALASGGVMTYVKINIDGTVTYPAAGTTSTSIYLDNISFRPYFAL